MNGIGRAGCCLVVCVGTLAAGCGGSSSDGMLPPADTTTLLDVQAQVFTPKCALSGCHAGSSPPFGLNLSDVSSSGDNLVGVASAEVPALLRVEPFDAANSYLYMKVTGDPRIMGDRMPLTGTPLGAADLTLIEAWIDQGAM